MPCSESEEQMKVIRVCLEQKVILMTRLLDITKEIEIQSLQDEINIASQLEARHNLMERIDKCDAVIKSNIILLSASLAEKIKQYLYSEGADDAEFEELYQNSVKWKMIFEKVKEIDLRAKQNLENRLDEAKLYLAQSRKNNAVRGGSLFHK